MGLGLLLDPDGAGLGERAQWEVVGRRGQGGKSLVRPGSRDDRNSTDEGKTNDQG
jgi:hypothetical protein